VRVMRDNMRRVMAMEPGDGEYGYCHYAEIEVVF
jgi:hypothetical protein